MYHSCHHLMENADKNLCPAKALALVPPEMVAHGEYIGVVKCHRDLIFLCHLNTSPQLRQQEKMVL